MVYLYQTVHLLEGVCYNLSEHIAVLDSWSQRLFGRDFSPEEAQLAKQTAAAARTDCSVSQFVRIFLFDSGEYRIEFAGVSLYRGYDLRSLTPKAVSLQYDATFLTAPTSAREAVEEVARQQAVRAGAAVAVCYDESEIVRTADGAPLFAVRGRVIYTSPAEESVERNIAVKAISAAGLELYEYPIKREELASFDELFFLDHRGITALSHCDGQPYMAILAERVAKALRMPF